MDTMTRKDAIQILADLIDNAFLHTWEEQNKALHMAIEALQFVEHFDLLKEYQSLQEVVRCKDCDRELGSTECPCCTKEYHINEETFYCAWGEMREE